MKSRKIVLFLASIIIDDNKLNSIISSRIYSDLVYITSLKFNGYDLLYDKNSNTWYYSMIEKSRASYNPKIKYQSDNKHLKISILNHKINKSIINNNETIKLLIYDDNYYYIYNIKCTTLPILNISYNKNLRITKDIDVDGRLYLFDNRSDAVNRVIRSNVKAHVRGNTSSSYPKKSYKLSLKDLDGKKNKVSLLGMRSDDDWILYAGYNDQEKIRNVFASNLWYYSCSKNNVFGVINGNQYKYVELFINNEYFGLYALGFKVDEKQLDLNNEYMFKKIDWSSSENNVSVSDDNKLAGYKLISNTDLNESFIKLKNYFMF